MGGCCSIRIIVDTREKKYAHIAAYFQEKGVEVIHEKLDVGDYMTGHDSKISVDRKQNLAEICSNLSHSRRRFEAECQRAKEAGIKLVVLVEHSSRIKRLEDVAGWKNPRLKESPYALSGLRLSYLMLQLAMKYGVEWQFCDKRSTGKKIIEILSRG